MLDEKTNRGAKFLIESSCVVYQGIGQLAVYRDAAYEEIPVSRYSEAGKSAMADYEKIGAQILKGWKNV